MKFPKKIKHRGKVLAVIYGRSKSRTAYRVAWHVAGKRMMKSFATYGGEDGAKQYADGLVKDLAKGAVTTALTPGQARDALSAFERLESFYQSTGQRISLLMVASECCEAKEKLNGHTIGEAVEGYMANIVTVKRKKLVEAVDQFIQADEPRTKASNGERAQLSSEYTRIRALRLRRFAKALPGHDVCDLSKSHLDVFIQAMADVSPKTRNHVRAGIKQFVQWATRNDFLTASNRLLEADSLRMEHANNGTVGTYTAKEFQTLLETATGEMQPLLAIAGLCGLRTAELLRLEWDDVWKVKGHIEISQTKSKTRSRRLVTICPSLSKWLRPYRNCSGKLWTLSENAFHANVAEVCSTAGVKRMDNALRHSFCTYHFAAHTNENQTAQQAGNSPQMIHGHYKGLATKAEAKKWFNVTPPKAAENVIRLTAAKSA